MAKADLALLALAVSLGGGLAYPHFRPAASAPVITVPPIVAAAEATPTAPTSAVLKPKAVSVPVDQVTVFMPLVALIGENPADIYFCVPGAPKPRSGCEGIAEYYRTEAECIAMRFDIIGREHANHRTVSSDCIARPLAIPQLTKP